MMKKMPQRVNFLTIAEAFGGGRMQKPAEPEVDLPDEHLEGAVELDIPEILLERLFQHQVEGVAWLYGMHNNTRYSGGILGDDMGLGKTFQVVTFLTGLFRTASLDISRALIIAPVSVLTSWQRELSEHLVPNVRRGSIVVVAADMTKKKRQQTLRDTFASRRPCVIVSSYQLVANMVDDFSQSQWDYVVLDEGHCIKNPSTKLTKAMHALPSRHRLLLTGTPVQNHLTEFWCLLDWCTQGRIFGSKKEFATNFESPIVAGQNPAASALERQLASQANQRLSKLTKPMLLQRKKSDAGMDTVLKLPVKTELVVWVGLSSVQRRLYSEYLSTREAQSALTRKNYPVEVINHLKTLCRHPFLLEASRVVKARKAEAARQGDDADVDNLVKGLGAVTLADTRKGDDAEHEADADADFEVGDGKSVFDICGRYPTCRELLQGSIKLRVTLSLTERLVSNGHRVLIFSQSRLMCDILQRVLSEVGLASCRIDGTITGKQRQVLIDHFNANKNRTAPPIALLTTKACGTGITLTGADRVIIHDPSWNPAEDKQAVDRAYRIGQTRDTFVYRLVSAGAVEEKIYEKQVFKDGVRVVLENGESSRYFSSAETKQLFVLGEAGKAEVMERLWKLSGEEIREWPEEQADDADDDVDLEDLIDSTGGGHRASRGIPGVMGYTRHDLYRKDEKGRDQTPAKAAVQAGVTARPAAAGAGKEKASAPRTASADIEEDDEGSEGAAGECISLDGSTDDSREEEREQREKLTERTPWGGRDALGRPRIPSLPGIGSPTFLKGRDGDTGRDSIGSISTMTASGGSRRTSGVSLSSEVKCTPPSVHRRPGGAAVMIDLTSPSPPQPARKPTHPPSEAVLVLPAVIEVDNVDEDKKEDESGDDEVYVSEGAADDGSYTGVDDLLGNLAGLTIAPPSISSLASGEGTPSDWKATPDRSSPHRQQHCANDNVRDIDDDEEDEPSPLPVAKSVRTPKRIVLSDSEDDETPVPAVPTTNRVIDTKTIHPSSNSSSSNDAAQADEEEAPAPWEQRDVSAHWKDFRNPYNDDDDNENDDDADCSEHSSDLGEDIENTEDEEEDDGDGGEGGDAGSLGGFIVDSDEEGEADDAGADGSIDLNFCGPDCKCDEDEEEEEEELSEEGSESEDEEEDNDGDEDEDVEESSAGEGDESYFPPHDDQDQNQDQENLPQPTQPFRSPALSAARSPAKSPLGSLVHSPIRSPVRSPIRARGANNHDKVPVTSTDYSHHRPPLRAPRALPLSKAERFKLCGEWGLAVPCEADQANYSKGVKGEEEGEVAPKHLLHLSDDDVSSYNQLLAAAAAVEASAREVKSSRKARREEAAALLCTALELCDADLAVHGRLAYYLSKME